MSPRVFYFLSFFFVIGQVAPLMDSRVEACFIHSSIPDTITPDTAGGIAIDFGLDDCGRGWYTVEFDFGEVRKVDRCDLSPEWAKTLDVSDAVAERYEKSYNLWQANADEANSNTYWPPLMGEADKVRRDIMSAVIGSLEAVRAEVSEPRRIDEMGRCAALFLMSQSLTHLY